MIVVRIELWPLGFEEQRRNLATVVIGNDTSGSRALGNYDVWVSHQEGTPFSSETTPREMIRDGKGVWKTGRVRKFPRRYGAVRLVRDALVAALGAPR